jgi:phosphate transport system substrate-binding protein
MKRTGKRMGTGLVVLALVGAASAAPGGADAYEPYRKPEGLKLEGALSSIGSDTMNNLMTFWHEGFKKHYPEVKIQVEGKGSTSAPPALIEGTAQLGPMSRPMKNEEIDKFEKKHGYKPTGLRTALDALAVFVNKDNPLESLSLQQVDAVFSKTRKRGGPEDVLAWGQLGLKGDWEKAPISLFGRNAASGTYGYFKEHALGKGDYKDTVKEQMGSATVVQGVAEDRFAIGYSGIGYVTPNVRALPLSEKTGGKAFAPNLENVISESYPLGRYLNLYVNRAPGKPMDPLVREFCRFIFSKEGQEVVVKDGFLPLPADVVKAELKKIE